MNIKLSIITVNFNGLSDTCAMIDSLPSDDPSLEIIVVDNASHTDEAGEIAHRYPHVKVIRSRRNLGFAGGNNLGMRAAHGEYILLLNNDTVVDKKTASPKPFGPLIERMESDSKVGCVCPKLRYYHGAKEIQYAGYHPLTRITLRNHAIGHGEPDFGQFDVASPTPYAHGAAMMIRRSVVDEVGLMPECYFLYYEEIDYSLIIRRAGYEIWYDPACTVYHKEARATGSRSSLRIFYMTRNRLLFARRNMPSPNRQVSYVYLMCIVALRDVLKYTFNGRFDLAKSVLRGIKSFITGK